MKISKKDALSWFEFFAQLPAGEQLLVKQQEIVYATFAQIEAVVIKRKEELMEQIPGLKTLKDRTLFVGPDEKFPDGCRSCLLGSGLTAIRKTNKCNLQWYKSEDAISDESAERLIRMMLERGHESPIEHFSVSVRIICRRKVHGLDSCS